MAVFHITLLSLSYSITDHPSHFLFSVSPNTSLLINLEKKKEFLHNKNVNKAKCPSSTILRRRNESFNYSSDDVPIWSAALSKCIPLRARDVLFIWDWFPLVFFILFFHSNAIHHNSLKCQRGNMVPPDRWQSQWKRQIYVGDTMETCFCFYASLWLLTKRQTLLQLQK